MVADLVVCHQSLENETERGFQAAGRICLGTDGAERGIGCAVFSAPNVTWFHKLNASEAHLQVTPFTETKVLIERRIHLVGFVAPQIVELVIEGLDVIRQLRGRDHVELSDVESDAIRLVHFRCSGPP